MAVWTAISNFPEMVLETDGHCSYCHRTIRAGESALVNINQGRGAVGGRSIRNIMCNEDCWAEWEHRYWENRSNKKSGE